jgi:hypothetical protein
MHKVLNRLYEHNGSASPSIPLAAPSSHGENGVRIARSGACYFALLDAQ